MIRKVLPFVTILAACSGSMTPSSSPIPGAASMPPSDGSPIVWPDEGPRTWTTRPTEVAITANDLRTRLYRISHDSMAGRRIGEPGNFKTTEYIASEFRRLGLRPAGDNGTYFQNLPWGTLVFDIAQSRLTAGPAMLEPRREWVPTIPTANNGIAGRAALENVPSVFVGRWGDSSVTFDPTLVRGKVVVFLAPLPPANPAAGGRGGGRGNAAPGLTDPRPRIPGAAAVLMVSPDSVASTTGAAFAMRNGMQVVPAGDAIPAATISTPAAARIFGKPVSELAMGNTGQPITASWNYEYRVSPTPGRNVVAVLPGSDPARATQYVLVGAHPDHVGTTAVGVDHDSLRAFNKVMRPQGANDRPGAPTADQQRRIDSLIRYARSIRPPRRDSINNGADDDGSGTVVMLEIAERFVTERPARSIIFISHQGEEAGLLGSKWFVDHPTVPRDSIVAAHNMDMLGKGRVTDVKFGGPSSVQTLGSRRLSREFGDIIDSVNAISPEPMAIDRSWDHPSNPLNRFCRSDQVNYVRSNIPVTYFSLGYSADYHQVTDEPQYIDYDHSARLGRFIHAIMTAVANRDKRPVVAGPDPLYPNC
ncbi:MAG: M28 family peptidase [Gemmatimonadaceae bacterium]